MKEGVWEQYATELGSRLRQARAVRGLSQERIAHEAGLAAFTYQKLEKGESRPGAPANPTLRTLVSLAAVLDVSLADLLPDIPDALTD
ncbi:helix-turn-helix domain-containing protein [Agromyces atrinae]|uniref:helix-turn-helix domain-containing protein n=1 Tax=Agromyces atrinae TaxID=592376 RepID=UPI001F5A2515|nr:helix-turn-helix transcriptional regulator [Agromyces atrinae]MCI2957961.1 helix-turn-helix domain-containing protein [Agromyces atrinae]